MIHLIVAAAVAGCGGSEKTTINNVMVSPEQQRSDLQRARDLGIITEKEFLQEVSEIGR
ncbi:hypothetical protein M1105_20500 [Limibaculum sp. FT325]|uniref:hypothetical protein n=1 Tax=Thermohalobaculum sediminis TaxID=2939436 RepID=UPI0020BF3CB9|nr:hypothetical protein [Limibaculum sediminis]MCL5779331.1 hypothetical protein [Limibaculum sediminis]